MAQYKTFSTMGKDANAPDPSTLVEVPRVTTFKQRQSLIQSNLLVVVDNYTDWCGPCKQSAPHYAVLATKYAKPGVCALVKENIEDGCENHPAPVRGVPCFHFYMNGQFLEEDTVTGADMNAIEQTIQRLIGPEGNPQGGQGDPQGGRFRDRPPPAQQRYGQR